MRILVADDDPVSRIMLVKALACMGKIDAFSNGEEVKEALLVCEERGFKYDIFILDALMPKISGLDIIKRVREREYRKSIKQPIPIIVTSGYSEYNNMCKEYGITWLQKPIEILALRNLVEEMLQCNSHS